MTDERLARVRQLLEDCHVVLVEMYPTRHWDEPLPNMPLLAIAQADISVTDAIAKLDWYAREINTPWTK